jgi:hypothetical protein
MYLKYFKVSKNIFFYIFKSDKYRSYDCILKIQKFDILSDKTQWIEGNKDDL